MTIDIVQGLHRNKCVAATLKKNEKGGEVRMKKDGQLYLTIHMIKENWENFARLKGATTTLQNSVTEKRRRSSA